MHTSTYAVNHTSPFYYSALGSTSKKWRKYFYYAEIHSGH